MDEETRIKSLKISKHLERVLGELFTTTSDKGITDEQNPDASAQSMNDNNTPPNGH